MTKETRDWLSEAQDLKAHPESQPTAKYALEVCMGLLTLLPDENGEWICKTCGVRQGGKNIKADF